MKQERYRCFVLTKLLLIVIQLQMTYCIQANLCRQQPEKSLPYCRKHPANTVKKSRVRAEEK